VDSIGANNEVVLGKAAVEEFDSDNPVLLAEPAHRYTHPDR
jgi:hypothetical protein